jgi:hypothetical protein
VVEATVSERGRSSDRHGRRAGVPLTHSVFWGTLAYTLIGGTLRGRSLRWSARDVCDLVPDPPCGTTRAACQETCKLP